ncbi:hypothetical protein SDC9_207841 [bioreactor metagenome]|uniref:Uncharacterized protein n=1 Tax=bioreactor metagenome TaxID=1076179 RepID=A0A645J9L6_9ZZZZ
MILSLPTFRLKAAGSRRNISEPRLRKSVKVVVVLIPPPVDPGEAPMNIRPIINSSPAWLNDPISTVLKPAVRAVALWKKDDRRSNRSSRAKKRVPPANSTRFMVSTILVCMLSLLHRRLRNTSASTKKPLPPKMINTAVVRFIPRCVR